MFNNDDLIYRYSRADALRDGVLVNVTEAARKVAIRVPVALTAAVHADFVEVPDGPDAQSAKQRRLNDLLSLLTAAIVSSGNKGPVLLYQLYARRKNAGPLHKVTLKAVSGPDDEGGPCLTVMLPNED
jgi:hypothetical protein